MDLQGTFDATAQLRNLKDFLIVYNSMTQHCFMTCVSNMNNFALTAHEKSCVLSCADRFTKGNHRFMKQFMQHTPEMVRKRNEEAEKQAQKLGATRQPQTS